jgi:hypothetical protein
MRLISKDIGLYIDRVSPIQAHDILNAISPIHEIDTLNELFTIHALRARAHTSAIKMR